MTTELLLVKHIIHDDVLFVILLIVSGVFVVLLRQEKAKVKKCKEFINAEKFRLVKLNDNQPFTLTQLGPITGMPLGQVLLGCIPFEILAQDSNPQILEVGPQPNNALNTTEVRVGVDRVKSVFLLINTNYGLKSWDGARPGEGWDEKIVGRLRLEFQDSNQEQELCLGHHLRDTHPGNQPWAVDRLRNENARNVWIAPDSYIALDLLRIDVPKSKFLRRIIVNVQLEVDQPRQVTLKGNPVGFPIIRIWGITCWTDPRNN